MTSDDDKLNPFQQVMKNINEQPDIPVTPLPPEKTLSHDEKIAALKKALENILQLDDGTDAIKKHMANTLFSGLEIAAANNIETREPHEPLSCAPEWEEKIEALADEMNDHIFKDSVLDPKLEAINQAWTEVYNLDVYDLPMEDRARLIHEAAEQFVAKYKKQKT